MSVGRDACPKTSSGIELGEPLLFRAAAWLMWGDVPDGMSINMHPMAFAAWLGLLATALNLFPIGQLDGGHVAYAVLGRRSAFVTIVTICVAIGLTYLFNELAGVDRADARDAGRHGPHHPPTLDDEVRIDRQPADTRRVRTHHADRVLHARAARAVRDGTIARASRRTRKAALARRRTSSGLHTAREGTQRERGRFGELTSGLPLPCDVRATEASHVELRIRAVHASVLRVFRVTRPSLQDIQRIDIDRRPARHLRQTRERFPQRRPHRRT